MLVALQIATGVILGTALVIALVRLSIFWDARRKGRSWMASPSGEIDTSFDRTPGLEFGGGDSLGGPSDP